MKTYNPTRVELESERRWHLVDAEGVPLGRLSSNVARLLTGKHKPTWVPHLDAGDFVVVVNAEKAVLTGRKEEQKVYYRHSGRPGNLRQETAGELRERKPTDLVRLAVKRMLPKNSLGRKQITKLKIYTGPEHPHEAQQPAEYPLEDRI